MFLKYRIMKKLKKSVRTWEDLQLLFPKISDYRLYKSTESLKIDGYVTIEWEDETGSPTIYRITNHNSFRNFRNRQIANLKNDIVVLGALAAIATLILTIA